MVIKGFANWMVYLLVDLLDGVSVRRLVRGMWNGMTDLMRVAVVAQ